MCFNTFRLKNKVTYVLQLFLVLTAFTQAYGQQKITLNDNPNNVQFSGVGSSYGRTRNINHPAGTKSQDLKKAVCHLKWRALDEDNELSWFGATGFLVNSVTNSSVNGQSRTYK